MNVWRGPQWADLATMAQKHSAECGYRADVHEQRAGRWQGLASPLLWLTAFLAGASGLSVLANFEVAANLLSVATVGVAATNAAFKPIETADRHKAASRSYASLSRRFEMFWMAKVPGDMEPRTDERWSGLMKDFEDLQTQLTNVEASSPLVVGRRPPRAEATEEG